MLKTQTPAMASRRLLEQIRADNKQPQIQDPAQVPITGQPDSTGPVTPSVQRPTDSQPLLLENPLQAHIQPEHSSLDTNTKIGRGSSRAQQPAPDSLPTLPSPEKKSYPDSPFGHFLPTLLKFWQKLPSPVHQNSSVIGITRVRDGFLLAQCAPGPFPRLEGLRHFQLPEGVKPRSTEYMAFLASALKSFCGKFDKKTLCTTLPANIGNVFFLNLPKAKGNELDAVALLAARKDEPFDIDKSVFDFRIVEGFMDKGVERLSAIAIALPQSRVAEIRHRCLQAGIRLSGLTSGQIPLYSLYTSGWLTTPWETYAVVEILHENTHILVMRGKSVLLRRMVRTGTAAFVETLQEISSSPSPKTKKPVFDSPQDPVYEIDAAPSVSLMDALSWDNGEQKKEVAGESTDTDSEEPFSPGIPDSEMEMLLRHGAKDEQDELLLRRSLTAVVRRLARQVETTISHSINSGEIAGVQGIIIAGPEGCMDMLINSLHEETGLPCTPQRLDGRATIEARREIAAALKSCDYASVLSAIGLPLAYGVTPNALLTNSDIRKASKHLVYAKSCIAAGLLLALGMGGIAASEFAGWISARSEAQALDGQIQGWKEKLSPEILKKEMADLTLLHQEGKDLLPRRLAGAFVSELASIVPPSVRITDMSLSLKPDTSTAGATRRNTAANRKEADIGRLAILKGVAYGSMLDRETRLAEFFNLLEHSPLVKSLSVQKDPVLGDAISFSVTCRIL